MHRHSGMHVPIYRSKYSFLPPNEKIVLNFALVPLAIHRSMGLFHPEIGFFFPLLCRRLRPCIPKPDYICTATGFCKAILIEDRRVFSEVVIEWDVLYGRASGNVRTAAMFDMKKRRERWCQRSPVMVGVVPKRGLEPPREYSH